MKTIRGWFVVAAGAPLARGLSAFFAIAAECSWEGRSQNQSLKDHTP
jgi:hypothetical protein